MPIGSKTMLSSQFYIEIAGQSLSGPVSSQLLSAEVEQHSLLPDTFTIRLSDPDLKLLDDGPFKLAEKITLKAEPEQESKPVTLMCGEIAAIEPAFNEYMIAELVIRGYDVSHKLYRTCQSKTYVNQKDSDIAATIAKAHALKAEISSTSTVYEHLFQHNQPDLHFLMDRAWRIGYECFVQDDMLFFRPPPQAASALTLTWGDDLLSFYPRLTMAEQVDEVTVRGWDPAQQKPIVGRAMVQTGKLFPAIKEKVTDWLGKFGGGKLVVTDQPVISQAEADLLAKARLNERSGAFVQAEGSAFRRPDIRAGQFVEVKGLGKRLSGRYLVTSATHIYTPEGLTTHFSVRGARTGSFAEQIRGERPLPTQPGIVPAIVTNTNDPKNWGRIKVKFPWLSESDESTWARIVSSGAGPDAGFFAVPDVGDEVFVAFEQGDFNFPLVLGGVWNGRHKLPPTAHKASAKPQVRTWTSRSGHKITLFDDEKKIEIKSAAGLTITLDDNGKNIIVQADNEIQLKARGNLSLEAGANLDLKASGNVTVKGATINLN
ncbi:MAG: VgrG-related protein [Anaerolineales bacterium]|nr:VgrG-related protein [Anaerolineales bacterium]